MQEQIMESEKGSTYLGNNAMLFTLANLFKVDQMLRRQPRSV
ncbi:hypothetical protein VCHC51A1_3617 [Vibrio cholerae HC-51A1]|jgi:hypothetical protein|nr:hypothetical protein VCHC02A1_0731 [Vibrio cholerae HC-02A1]EKG53144.1 hypothetical protein VCHC50A1_0737 [Vibrio cholerae HC-50A1]EKG58043.1 hypothetical protein VCHC52A1_0739 [Vibrio cholerae HC-52A1]EKG63750.1 hypothetical protein VCHC56A1_0825 [Vibrio cholerae HC-56A1]EKG64172.1 hypothetical protein VCHC55A1_0740 [Vibrio cholerae HC-55A1]EKG66142.1 hypothetical protein VCHC57A1_3691 [Vibrio cholerae HC-57A1]EKG87385.1 hypothetical protein VCHC51A1_3617 [Vibrio cholerae HC-51A1]EKK9487